MLPLAAILCPAPPPQAQATPPELEWRGQYGGFSEAGSELVLNAGRWRKLWRRLDKPMPELDFSTHCAVVAYAGQRPTGGFTIEFEEPVAQGEDLLLRWRVRKPDPHSFVTEAFAQPWKVKAILRPKGRVKLEQLPE